MKSTPRSLVRYAGVLAALLPLLPLMATLRAHRNPEAATAIALAGSWRHFDGAVEQGSAVDLDDSTWPEQQLPGVPCSTFGVREEWARRWVEVPAEAVDQEWTLVMGGSRSGMLSVFVNGRLIASDGIRPGYSRTSFFSSDAFAVPRGVLTAGRNLVVLHWDVGEDNYFGFVSRMFYLAPAVVARPAFAEVFALENFLQSGPPFLFLFLVMLVVAMLVYEWDTGDRARYFVTLGLIIGPSLLLLNSTGAVLSRFLDSSDRLGTQLYFAIGLTTSATEFLCQYFATAPRLRRANRYVAVVLVVVAAIIATIDRTYYFIFYALAGAPYGLIIMVVLGVLAVREAVKKPSVSSITLSSSLVMLVVSIVLDISTDLGALHLPRFFVNSVGMLPVVVGLIVLNDFIRLSASNKELMASLNQRNAALGTALAAANEAMRAKNEFLATVSHELRTPLNPIINLPEGLLEDFVVEPDGARRFTGDATRTAGHIESIARAGRTLLGLVEQVLEMSTLQTGRAVIELKPLKVSDLLEDVRRAIAPVAQARNVNVVFDAGELEFTGDREKLAQVLLGLLSNAVKFSPEGSPVDVTCRRDGANVEFSVRDRGIGIAPEHHERIFEMFRQVDGGHTRRFGGVGLGLAIARQLTQLHGGRLWVESAPGQGSTFHVSVPVSRASA